MSVHFDYAHLKHDKLGQIKIHYAYAGKPECNDSASEQKPLLLCLHGFPEFWRVWQHQLNDLSDDFFVVAPDLRGYNLSDKPSGVEHYQTDELVNDALGLVAHLGYEKFTLVGHDWGGLVAWTLASLHPERLEKLIIINSPHPRIYRRLLANDREQIAASQYITKFQQESAVHNLTRNNFDLLWRFGFNELVEKDVFGEEDKLAHIEAWSQPNAVESMLGSYRAECFQIPAPDAVLPMATDEQLVLANKIEVQTLVIWGMDDTALTRNCLNELEEFVPNVIVMQIPGAGHGVIHEKPSLISKSIQHFSKNL